MTSHRFASAALIPLLGLGLLTSVSLYADTPIPGSSNSNPATGTAPPKKPDKDKPSKDDGPPPDPCGECQKPKKCDNDCPEDNPPKVPGSVDISFPLDAFPLEGGAVAAGNLRLYIDTLKTDTNMGDPVHLQYNSIASAKIIEQITPTSLNADLPSGVDVRYTIQQISGRPLFFDHRPGSPILTLSGSGAASHARAELITESGTTYLRQYRSDGGYMDFNTDTAGNIAGKILRWHGLTGRSITFDPVNGTAALGLDIILAGGKIRQVKSAAGLLDVIADSGGRGYTVSTYLPSEVDAKTGNENTPYTLKSGAKPKKVVHISHASGSSKLVATFTDYAPGGAAGRRVRTLTYTYVNTFDGGHEWDLTTVDGGTTVADGTTEGDGSSLTSTRHVIPDHDREGMRWVVREVKDGAGKQLYRKEVIQQYENGWKGWTDVEEIETPGMDPSLRMVRSFRYGTDPNNYDFSKLNWQTTDTGRVYEFKYDNNGRMIERRSQWQDGANGSQIVETFSYDAHAGEVLLPGDERPRTTTVAVGTATSTNNPVLSESYFAAYYDAANGDCYTEVREDAATPGSGYDAAGNRRTKKIYYAAAAAAESIGRLKEVVDENGLRTVITYAAPTGGGLIETTTGPLNSNGVAKAGLTRRVSTEKDAMGRVLEKTEALATGNSTYVDFQRDVYDYAPQGQLMSITRTDLLSNRSRVVSSYTWRGDLKVSATAEDGSSVTTAFDGFGRVTSTTQGAAAAVTAAQAPLPNGAGFPAQPAITRTTAGAATGGATIGNLYGAEWGNRTVTTTAGAGTAALSLMETFAADARGRITSATDADGYMTKTSHLRNGLETTVTRPDGGTVTTCYFLDGRLKSRTGSGIVPEYYSYAANANADGGGLTTTVHYGRADGPRYQSTTTDMLGRTVLQVVPGHKTAVVSTTTTYVGGTRLPARMKSSDTQVPVRFFEYDGFGTLFRQGETVRETPTGLNISSVDDRVRETELTVVNTASDLWVVRTQYTYPYKDAAVGTRCLLSESKTKVAGFTGNEVRQEYSMDALGHSTTRVIAENAALQLRSETTTSDAYSGSGQKIYHGGLLVEQRQPGDTLSTFMTYDALGRLRSTRQARHVNADSIVYAVGKNQVTSRTDAKNATTSYTYYNNDVPGAGRVASVTSTTGKTFVRRSAYDVRGNLIREWGNATAPVAYGYDGYNQLQFLSTWRTAVPADSTTWPAALGAANADVTRWQREESTGLLETKTDANLHEVNYDYDDVGRVIKRTSARSIVTDYTYTAWGQADVTTYHDSTPAVDIDYDRLGRQKNVSNGLAQSHFDYAGLVLDAETISYNLDGQPGFEFSRVLDRYQPSFGRDTGWQLKNGTTVENQVTYNYKAIDGRLDTVVGGGDVSSPQTFTYAYTPNSNLIESVTQGDSPAIQTLNIWEPNRDVLDYKENKVGTTTVSKYDYTVNDIGQRENVATSGTAFPATPAWTWGYDDLGQITSADSSVAAQDRAYQYNAIGNRQRAVAGTVDINAASATTYTANPLNQYDAIGTLVPVYDLDGNATNYPLPAAPSANSVLGWNAENRLTSTTVGSVVTTYQYDAYGRRIAKTTGTTSTTRYLYARWNCIAEYTGTTGTTSTLSNAYLWGLDLTGTLQGAGGVGGLLAVSQISTSPIASFYPTYDGNGNVSEYLASDGTITAHFEYDPFGNIVVNTDPTGQLNYRFSTKPVDSETGLYYYGYRYYDPVTGRWPSREPIGEAGSLNLYSFIGNNGTTDFDILGLCSGSRKALLDAACKAQQETEKQGVEFCAAICCKDGKYTKTAWNRGSNLSCKIPKCPEGHVKVMDLHSHPGVDGSPSGSKPGDPNRPRGDTNRAVDKNVDYWIVTDVPFSNNDDEVWMVKYNRNGSLGGWIYNCKTGEFEPRQ